MPRMNYFYIIIKTFCGTKTVLFIKNFKKQIKYISSTMTLAFNQYKMKFLIVMWTSQNTESHQFTIQDSIYKCMFGLFPPGWCKIYCKCNFFSTNGNLFFFLFLLKSYLHYWRSVRVGLYTTNLQILAQNHTCVIAHLIFQVHLITEPEYRNSISIE